jgi:hypothetical protein
METLVNILLVAGFVFLVYLLASIAVSIYRQRKINQINQKIEESLIDWDDEVDELEAMLEEDEHNSRMDALISLNRIKESLLEEKIDLLYKHFELEYKPATIEEVPAKVVKRSAEKKK